MRPVDQTPASISEVLRLFNDPVDFTKYGSEDPSQISAETLLVSFYFELQIAVELLGGGSYGLGRREGELLAVAAGDL